MHTEIKSILSTFVLAVITSCSGSALLQEPDQDTAGTPINFGVIENDSSTSRGKETNIYNLDEFAVSATMYSPSGERTLLFAHEEYKIQWLGQEVYRTVSGNVHYWLSDKNEYNFFAYSPSPYIYFPEGEVDKFIYTTPKSVLLHPDLVVATSINAAYGQPVKLTFTHPLAEISLYESSAIRYGKIHSVTFGGIIDHGEYNMLTGEWIMSTNDTDSFTWVCDAITEPNTDLTGQYYNFFFVPQELGEDAAITVKFENAYGVIEIHTVPLSGTWQAGHRYRYSLSL